MSGQPPSRLVEVKKILGYYLLIKWSSKPTNPIKQKSKNFKISGHQLRWPRPLPGAILMPPALLVFAD